MNIEPFKKYPSAFSNWEALVVIIVTFSVSMVLVPALAFRMGWMQPQSKDLDINWRDVKHPGATFVPKHLRHDAIDRKSEETDK